MVIEQSFYVRPTLFCSQYHCKVICNASVFVVIDDDRDDIEIFMDACHEIEPSARVLLFEDGNGCLDELPRLNVEPDIIFINVQMPRMSGQQLVQKLKSQIQLAMTPIVVYSTECDDDLLREFKYLGVSEFFQKPNSFHSLKAGLSKILNSVLDGNNCSNSDDFVVMECT